jgi:hypothetical protein
MCGRGTDRGMMTSEGRGRSDVRGDRREIWRR